MPIFNPGLKLLLKAANTPLEPNPDHPIAYLHFVDGDGNTIVPEYEPDGLRTSAGPVSGARYVLADGAAVAALEARVAALEAKFDGTATVSFDRVQVNFVSPLSSMLKIQARNAPSGSWIDGLTIDSNLIAITPVTRIAWFGATTVARQTIPNVSALSDTETACINYGLYTRLP